METNNLTPCLTAYRSFPPILTPFLRYFLIPSLLPSLHPSIPSLLSLLPSHPPFLATCVRMCSYWYFSSSSPLHWTSASWGCAGLHHCERRNWERFHGLAVEVQKTNSAQTAASTRHQKGTVWCGVVDCTSRLNFSYLFFTILNYFFISCHTFRSSASFNICFISFSHLFAYSFPQHFMKYSPYFAPYLNLLSSSFRTYTHTHTDAYAYTHTRTQ